MNNDLVLTPPESQITLNWGLIFFLHYAFSSLYSFSSALWRLSFSLITLNILVEIKLIQRAEKLATFVDQGQPNRLFIKFPFFLLVLTETHFSWQHWNFFFIETAHSLIASVSQILEMAAWVLWLCITTPRPFWKPFPVFMVTLNGDSLLSFSFGHLLSFRSLPLQSTFKSS